MKNLSIVINAVLAIAIGVLFFLHFRDCKNTTCCKAGTTATTASGGSLSIAYVDLDTLQENFTYYKDKRSDLQKRQKDIENAYVTGMQNLQNQAYEFQKKAATMTQSEGENAQQSLLQQKNQIETQKDNSSQTLQSDLILLNTDVFGKLDSVIKDYNKDHKYAYILSYQKGGAILYKEKSGDITADIVNQLNKMMPVKK